MARLRALHIGTRTVGNVAEDQHILILDGLTPDQAQNDFEAFAALDGVPPILTFGFDVDLPDVDAARLVMPTKESEVIIDASRGDDELMRVLRKLIRIGDPQTLQALKKAQA